MLNKNFKTESNKKYFCIDHPHARHWLPIGQAAYLCSTCTPPPAVSMIARWANQGPPTIKATPLAARPVIDHIARMPPTTLACERPVCPHCNCSWVIELDHASGVALRCWACKCELSQAQIDAIVNREPALDNLDRLLPFKRWFLQQSEA